MIFCWIMISCDTPCCFCQCNSFKFRAYSIKYFRSNRSMFSFRWVSFFRPPTKLWEGNIFIRVCMSFSPRGPLHTAPARSLSTIKGPLALTPASHTWWSRPEICSNFYTLGPPIPPFPSGTDTWWLKHVQWASRRYASYWNAFLFQTCECPQPAVENTGNHLKYFLIQWCY